MFILVREKAFAAVSTLKELDLRENSISDIADNAFKDLINLKELNLEKNKLVNITRLVVYNFQIIKTDKNA